ncbi:MAG: NAD(P)H-hydrate epimerase [Phycisphaeraceae bacterium]
MEQDTNIAPLTRGQVREVDRLAIEELGIPGVVLMENAAAGAVRVLLDTLGQARGIAPGHGRGLSVAVLCGGGNNGGDGYAMARHLHNQGVAVTIYAFKPPAELRGDALTNCAICQRMGLTIVPAPEGVEMGAMAAGWEQADAVVDALLGTGFSGTVRPSLAAAIARVNALDGPVVLAVDVPSGLDCDSGQVAGGGEDAAVRADVTVTFVARKVGFDKPGAAAWLGAVVVVGIGAPPELAMRVRQAGRRRGA